MVGLVERVGQLAPRQKLKPHRVGPKAPSFLTKPVEDHHFDEFWIMC